MSEPKLIVVDNPLYTHEVNLEITQDRIDQGRTLDCWHCPLALSLNTVLLPEYFAEVHAKYFRIRKREPSIPLMCTSGRFTDLMQRYVSTFDANKWMVQPTKLVYYLPVGGVQYFKPEHVTKRQLEIQIPVEITV